MNIRVINHLIDTVFIEYLYLTVRHLLPIFIGTLAGVLFKGYVKILPVIESYLKANVDDRHHTRLQQGLGMVYPYAVDILHNGLSSPALKQLLQLGTVYVQVGYQGIDAQFAVLVIMVDILNSSVDVY